MSEQQVENDCIRAKLLTLFPRVAKDIVKIRREDFLDMLQSYSERPKEACNEFINTLTFVEIYAFFTVLSEELQWENHPALEHLR